MRMRSVALGVAFAAAGGLTMASSMALAASAPVPLPVTIDAGWQLQDAAKVTEAGVDDRIGSL